jgi:DNA repair protein RadD
MNTIKLRWYQQAAVDAVRQYWGRGGGNPLVQVPTGGGKSAIAGELCRWLAQDCGARVLVATHRKELIVQDEEAIRRVWPGANVGVYSAGLNRRQVRQITVGGVQSLYRKASSLGRVDVVLVDEAHLVAPKSGGQYGRLLGGLREVNCELRVCGLTATPYRLGQGLLTQGEEKIFDCVIYSVDISKLIAERYLSPLVTGSTSGSIDIANVRIQQGEYVAKDLELAADVSEVTDAVARDILQSGRKHVLVFGCGVEHAAHLRNAIRLNGLSCELVTGETPPAERKRLLREFKEGSLQAISSCDVLTTGFDAPLVDCVVLVRPTMSPALYVQMVGRGSRIADGKSDCLVLDYGGNIARHGPIDAIKIKPKQDGAGSILKDCPSCYAEVPAAKRVCPHCGHEWPPPERQERKANSSASKLDVVIGDKIQKTRHDIEKRVVRGHTSYSSGKRTLRVEYYEKGSSSPVATEFVCLEHDGFARSKAEEWWRKNTDGARVPETVDEAVQMEEWLRPIKQVVVKSSPNEKFPRVTAYVFEKTEQQEPEGEPEDDVPF